MKQTFNLLAEVLALPLSELFLDHDLLAECIGAAQRKAATFQERIPVLNKEINQMGPQAAGYINLHTTFVNTSALQNMVNYVYRGEDIVRLMDCYRQLNTPWCVANHYATILFKRAAKTFLTSRNGIAAFKYWSSGQEAHPGPGYRPPHYPQPDWNQDLLRGKFEIRRIEAWHSLLQCLPESFFLSSFAACLADPADSADPWVTCYEILLGFGDTVHIADVLLDKILDKGLAETHLHANASRSFDLNWESILNDAAHGRMALTRSYTPIFQKGITQKDSQERAREALVARALLGQCLRKRKTLKECLECLPSAAGLCQRDALLQAAVSLTRFSTPQRPLSSCVTRMVPFLQSLGGNCDDRYLLRLLNLPHSAALTAPGFGERCLISWSMLHISSMPEDVSFTALFLYYLRLKNYFYRCRTQDSKESGLLHFQRFYAQSTDGGGRTADEKMVGSIYSAIKDHRICKVELRTAPPISSRVHLADAEREIASAVKKQLGSLIRQHICAVILLYSGAENRLEAARGDRRFLRWWNEALRDIHRCRWGQLARLLEAYQVPIERVRPHRVGLIYHFIKQGERSETDSCFLRGGQTPVQLDQHAAFSFGRTRFQCQAATAAIDQVRKLTPEVSRIIVGLDAASLELSTDPWVFAPAFRQARELDLSPFCRTPRPERRIEKRMLGLTYHVGEEFHHPLSGLRHLSEAMEFYKLHTGDRLGHGLVLGIDLDRWFSRHSLITIPRLEWLENCLWAWEIAAHSPAAEGLAPFSKFLEAQIMFSANAIYGTLDGITAEKLAYAYHSKALGFQDLSDMAREWARIYRPVDPRCVDCLTCSDARFFPCACWTGQAVPLWWSEDSLALSHHCRYYKNKMAEEILWEPNDREIDLVKALQAYLRRRVAMRGIILEENPSSNAVIGEMDGVLYHPICGLRAPEGPEARVITSVNTDDPSVFSASVANEHALVYFALIHQGHSVEDALAAVDEMRRVGVNSSFLGQEPPFEQLLDEYETILSCL